MKIPFYDLKRQHADYLLDLQDKVSEAVASGWYIRGPYVEEFENKFANYLGVKNVVGVGNGLDALTLILRAYKELGKLSDGDEIIVPANTYIATVLAISEVGLVPVLVEPDIETYNIDVLKVKDHINSNTKAILTVNLYGLVSDVESLRFICDERNLLLIEDNAQATGAMLGKKYSGTFGDAAGFSFYPTKNLGCLGDGGAVVTDDKDLATMVRALANYGSQQKYVHSYKGVNSRLDEIHAAALTFKLDYLDIENNKRRAIAKRYLAEIDNPHVVLPIDGTDKNHVWHLFVIRVKERERFVQYLEENGISVQIHYPTPIFKHNAYREFILTSKPITEKICAEVVSLPLAPYLTEEELDYIIEKVNNF